jgi:hypothetical protein
MAELIQIRNRDGLALASKGSAAPSQLPRTPIAIPRAPGEAPPLDAERVTLIRARTRAARRDERRRELAVGLGVVALTVAYLGLVAVAVYAAGARFGIW